MNFLSQNRCLICQEIIYPDIGWGAIFSKEKEHRVCTDCDAKFEKIEGDICRMCSRPFRLLDEQFRDGELCHDCTRWEEDPDWQGFLQKNTSIFLYNDFLKEVMAKYKFRGDYVLAKVFAVYFKEVMKGWEADLFVPIPLSEERLYERGFNQAAAILTESGIMPTDILSRVHTEKQSKKSRSERIHLPQVFQIDTHINLHGKKVILMDDIYTTGSTLRHAAKLLKQAGADAVWSITIAR
ncbi:ComF family protein [Neobacillus sp. GCM10023253]|uniref:ComF family protein n=1 Tax=Neobacillus sp. GCM10023253 TaxID=3252644 RepID=UPI003612747F